MIPYLPQYSVMLLMYPYCIVLMACKKKFMWLIRQTKTIHSGAQFISNNRLAFRKNKLNSALAPNNT